MTNDLRPLPPPSHPDTSATSPAQTPLRHPVALFAVAAGLGAIAAIIVGLGTGAFVMAAGSSECSPSDGWCELGAALFALLAGFATGAITYIVAGVTAIARCRPPGRRSTHVLAHIALPIALVLVSIAVSGVM